MDSQDRTERQDSLYIQQGEDTQDRAAGTKQIGQDDENPTAQTGPRGQKSWGQECCGSKAGKGQSGYEVCIGQPGHDRPDVEDSEDGTDRTKKRGQGSKSVLIWTGHVEHDNRDWSVIDRLA